MLAGALQEASLYITPNSPTEMCFPLSPQTAAPVFFTVFVAPIVGCVCLLHGSLPCNSICVLLAVQGKSNHCKPT